MGMLSHARKRKARQLGLATNNLGIANKGRGRQKLRKQKQEAGLAAMAEAVQRKYAEMKGEVGEQPRGGRRQRVKQAKLKAKASTSTRNTPAVAAASNIASSTTTAATLDTPSSSVNTVIHEVVYCTQDRKASSLMESLLQVLGESKSKRRPQILITVSDRESLLRLMQFFSAESVMQALHQPSFAGLHEDTPEEERKTMVADFWMKRTLILITTEKVVEQLRVPRFVVNFDFPRSVAEYTARANRVAKTARDATIISLFTSAEVALAPELIRVLRASNQFISRELLDAAIEHLERKLGRG